MPVDSTLPPGPAALSDTAAPQAPPPVPGLNTLAAAALGTRSALAEVLAYSHRFVTVYCRAALGASPSADLLAAEVCATLATGWPTAHTQRRDFLEFVHATASRAVALGRWESPHTYPLGPVTDMQREILLLRAIVGLSPMETAVALRIPVLTVHRETSGALAAAKRANRSHRGRVVA
ncbi:hypothetical protein D7D52_33200 [Nocardia yunnanensis]|uniref:RNA polymerase sigma factor 70 region 4 type 2 domain-containing protein n=1 Tax=Nocardia yunnanensis TaxID=2382165 RepID=A0A386ZJY2_9NOCA|nr:hypothetical protein [Nocardia yunnanensis]AYF77871.1 hypothetical protein D7D52_33200 [Nocardia yunnanensis]